MILKNSFSTDIEKLNDKIGGTNEDIDDIITFCANITEFL